NVGLKATISDSKTTKSNWKNASSTRSSYPSTIRPRSYSSTRQLGIAMQDGVTRCGHHERDIDKNSGFGLSWSLKSKYGKIGVEKDKIEGGWQRTGKGSIAACETRKACQCTRHRVTPRPSRNAFRDTQSSVSHAPSFLERESNLEKDVDSSLPMKLSTPQEEMIEEEISRSKDEPKYLYDHNKSCELKKSNNLKKKYLALKKEVEEILRSIMRKSEKWGRVLTN
ncbi:hypothetical protein HAX54_040895, partial [Datura stramonium]|nr:hypothetical protein [Datura stramonium]